MKFPYSKKKHRQDLIIALLMFCGALIIMFLLDIDKYEKLAGFLLILGINYLFNYVVYRLKPEIEFENGILDMNRPMLSPVNVSVIESVKINDKEIILEGEYTKKHIKTKYIDNEVARQIYLELYSEIKRNNLRSV